MLCLRNVSNYMYEYTYACKCYAVSNDIQGLCTCFMCKSVLHHYLPLPKLQLVGLVSSVVVGVVLVSLSFLFYSLPKVSGSTPKNKK